MAYPKLGASHQILGTEYCSGYTDISGNWNNGFYCPQPENYSSIVSCCGTSAYKYCCTEAITDGNWNNFTTIVSTTEINQLQPVTVTVPQNIFEAPIVVAVISFFVLLCLILVILVYCYYSQCCLYWRKQWNDLPQNPADLEAASASTSNNLYNIYSVPIPMSSVNFSRFLPGGILPPPQVYNNNNPRFNISTFTNPDSFNNGSIYAELPPIYSTLNEYETQNESVNTATTTSSISSTIGQTSVYYSTSNESIPLTLTESDSGVGNSSSGLSSNSNASGSSGSTAPTTTAILRNPNRPLTLVNIRNNTAYITSAVPMTDLLKRENCNLNLTNGNN